MQEWDSAAEDDAGLQALLGAIAAREERQRERSVSGRLAAVHKLFLL